MLIHARPSHSSGKKVRAEQCRIFQTWLFFTTFFSLVEKKQRFKPGWLFPQPCWIGISLVWSNAERLKLASVHTKAVSSSEILVIVKQTNKDKHPFVCQWHSDKRVSCWSYFTSTNDRSSARRMFPQLNPFIIDFSQIDLPFLRQETYSLSISVSIKLPFPVLSVHWQEKSVACSNISALHMKRTIAVEKESSDVKCYWKKERKKTKTSGVKSMKNIGMKRMTATKYRWDPSLHSTDCLLPVIQSNWSTSRAAFVVALVLHGWHPCLATHCSQWRSSSVLFPRTDN